MFTGLVEALAVIRRVEPGPDGHDLLVRMPFAAELAVGESIAVNGACLTVVGREADACRFQAGPETLRRTNLGSLRAGDRVNVERSLRLSDRLGGHLVQGHVDGLGQVAERSRRGDWETVWFRAPETLTMQMVPKGSVAVDGVSLTLVDVAPGRFSVALIPHTLANTTLGFKPVGADVNIETDLMAKYVGNYLRALGLLRGGAPYAGITGPGPAGPD